VNTLEVVGHGGAGDFYPGNSRKSVEKALELGVDRIEIDVQVAAGDQLVLIHDDVVRFGGKKTRVSRLSVDQLRDALEGLLTLDEVIDLTRGKSSLMVDMKSQGYEHLVAQALVRRGIANQTIVSYTFALSLRRVRKGAPGVSIGLSTGHISTVMRRNTLISVTSGVLAVISPLPIIAAAKMIHADHLMLNYRICSPRFVRTAHAFGLSVYAWTVNHPGPIRKLIECGVDGLISNRPDLVIEQLRDE
jgi:glycerophosphoryl diester phosphodiesterase